MKTILSAAAALAIVLGSATAFADSGDGPRFDLPQSTPATGSQANIQLAAAPIVGDVGSQGEAVFGGQLATVALNMDGLLPANGNEAPVQSANSAPAGFSADTVELAAHTASFPHYALR